MTKIYRAEVILSVESTQSLLNNLEDMHKLYNNINEKIN